MPKNRLEAFSDGVIAIIPEQGQDSLLAGALGRDRKAKLSLVCYSAAHFRWASQ